MVPAVWEQCLNRLRNELSPDQFNTYVAPLQADDEEGRLRLLAPNAYVVTWIRRQYLERIREVAAGLSQGAPLEVSIDVGSRPVVMPAVPVTGPQGPGRGLPGRPESWNRL